MKLILTLTLALLPVACAAKTPTAPPAQEAPVSSDCTTTLTPASGTDLRAAIDAAAEGAILCIEASEVLGTLGFSKSITLRGVGKSAADVVLDGDMQGPVLHVREDGISVRLENLTLRGGSYDSGGALSLKSDSSVALAGCVIADNSADEVGGGAFYVKAGTLTLTDCALTGNSGPKGGAVFLGGGAVSISGGSISGNSAERGAAIAMRNGGALTLDGVSVSGNEGREPIYLKGSDRGTPTVTATGLAADAIVDDGGRSTVTVTP